MSASESQKTDTKESNVTNIETAKVRRAKQRIELEALLLAIDGLDPYDTSLSPVELLELSEIFDRCARLPRAYDGEVAKRCCDHFSLNEGEIYNFKATINQLRQELTSGLVKKKQQVREANRQDYFDLYESSIGPLERDIFSGELLRKDEDDIWVPAIEDLGICHSDAAVMEAEGVCKFRATLLESHFKKLQSLKKKRLILDFVEWDGVDRLKSIARCLIPEGNQPGIDSEVIEDMLKAWCSGVMARLADPYYQNPCLIFKGAQGRGKDFLVDVLTNGFRPWAKQLEISNNHKDDFGQLNRALIFKVPEFDKVAKTDQAMLKDMIWRVDTNLRNPYDKRSRERINRCSFVATTNTEDIYKDPTGHRRFWPVNIGNILWDYPCSKEDSKQIAAQTKALAEAGYKANAKTQLLIKEFLDSRTPDSIEVELAEHWDWECQKFLQGNDVPIGVMTEAVENGWLGVAEARDAGIVDRICRSHKITERYLWGKLGVLGRKRRNMAKKGYAFEKIGHISEIGHEIGHGKSNKDKGVIF